ncbi:hypothetical protein [Sphingomonas sp.]|uniref:hypothetical protein n=1 Tax=Sphingomonas sp. TaxID=28214 RepID=UPI0035C82298
MPFACCSAAAQAQDMGESWDGPLKDRKLTVSANVALTNAKLQVVDSKVDVPADAPLEDMEVTISDKLSVSTKIVSASVGYRVLPFLQVSARAGLSFGSAATGVTIKGTPTGALSDFVDGPIELVTDAENDVNGYSLGLGANAFVPLARIGEDRVAGWASFQHLWNNLNGSEVVSRATRTSAGLAYAVDPSGGIPGVFRIGASYNWLTRDVRRTKIVGDQEYEVRITQKYVNPWSVEAGVGLPVADRLVLGIGASQQIEGGLSGFLSLQWRP